MTTEPAVSSDPIPAGLGAPAADGPAVERARRYAASRSVVIPDLKVIYLPVPKAGCTSMLWLLAELAGLETERFHRSATREVTLPMTVHDLWVWGRNDLRLSDLSDEDRAAAFASDDWFRFTMVREPASRLWSAWQSKLLMREPRFVEMFGEEPWFPALPDATSPESVLDDFHAFVAALAANWDSEALRDPHWTPQWDIVDSLPLNHVGRLETLEETMRALRDHVGERVDVDKPLPRENRTPMPYDAVVYDDATAGLVNDLYADDFDRFGYQRIDAHDDAGARAEWLNVAALAFPVVHEAAARHERLGALVSVVEDRSEKNRALKRDIESRESTIAELKATAEETAKTHAEELAQAAGRLKKVTAQRDSANETLEGIYASKSWKVTRPLRRLSRKARGG